MPGAQYQNVSDVGAAWTVPCDVEVNITFKIGGNSFPVHPLDATMAFGNLPPSNGKPMCIGAVSGLRYLSFRICSPYT